MAGATAWVRAHSELGVAVLLLAVGAVVLADAASMPEDFLQRGPVGPAAFPTVVGIILLATGGLLGIDILRGGRGEEEAGEDIDLTSGADWRTVLLLVAVFVLTALVIEPLGWPVAGAFLFWGCAWALGSRRWVRDPLIAVGLSVASYFLFAGLLGVSLPAGVLEGVI